MVDFFEADDDPKKPRPTFESKKREGWAESEESHKDDGYDRQRHVHVVRC